jgi:hypothetical protein
MKNVILMIACLFAGNIMAKDKILPLPQAAAADLQGKTLVVTRHKIPPYTAMTAGKAGFALLGAGLMIAEGNKIIRENEVPDPAGLLEAQLAPAFATHYGMQIKPATTAMIDVEKPKQIAATQTDTDYILDIRSGGWMSSYYPADWAKYWILYSVQVQLINAKDGSLVSNMACNASTHKHANSPSKDQMYANKAQLFKSVSTAHGWTCMKLLGAQQFLLPETALAATPAEYVDPLKTFAEFKAAPAANAETAAVPVPSTDIAPPTTATEAPTPALPAVPEEPAVEGKK